MNVAAVFLIPMTEEQEQFIIQYRKRKLQESIQRRERAAERRRKLDHERYMRSREERKARQRDYYLQNRESILTKKKLKYQEQILYLQRRN